MVLKFRKLPTHHQGGIIFITICHFVRLVFVSSKQILLVTASSKNQETGLV